MPAHGVRREMLPRVPQVAGEQRRRRPQTAPMRPPRVQQPEQELETLREVVSELRENEMHLGTLHDAASAAGHQLALLRDNDVSSLQDRFTGITGLSSPSSDGAIEFLQGSPWEETWHRSRDVHKDVVSGFVEVWSLLQERETQLEILQQRLYEEIRAHAFTKERLANMEAVHKQEKGDLESTILALEAAKQLRTETLADMQDSLSRSHMAADTLSTALQHIDTTCVGGREAHVDDLGDASIALSTAHGDAALKEQKLGLATTSDAAGVAGQKLARTMEVDVAKLQAQLYELQEEREKNRRCLEDAAWKAAEALEVQHKLVETETHLGEVVESLSQSTQALEQRDSRMVELRALLAERESCIAELYRTAEVTRSSLEELQTEAVNLRAESEDLRRERAEAQKSLEQRISSDIENEAKVREAVRTKEELARMKEEAARLQELLRFKEQADQAAASDKEHIAARLNAHLDEMRQHCANEQNLRRVAEDGQATLRAELIDVQQQREAEAVSFQGELAKQKQRMRDEQAVLRAELHDVQQQRSKESASFQDELIKQRQRKQEGELAALRAELSDMQRERETETSRLSQQLTEAKAELLDMQRQRESEISHLSQQMAEARSEHLDVLRQREAETSRLYQQLAEARSQLLDAQSQPDAETSRMSQQLAEVRSGLLDVQRESEAESSRLSKQLAEARSELLDVQRQREAETSRLSQQLAEAQSEHLDVQRQHEAETSRLSQKLAEAQSQFLDVQQQREAETSRLSQKLAEAQSQLLDVQQQREAETSRLSQKLAEAQSQFLDVQQQREAETSRLSHKLAEAQSELLDVQQQCEAETSRLSHKLAEAQSQLLDVQQQREAETSRLSQQLEEARSEHVDLQPRSDADTVLLSKQLAEARSELLDAQRRHDAETSRLSQQLVDAQSGEASAAGKLSSIEDQHAELKQILALGDEQRLELQCRLITAESHLNEASRDSLILEGDFAACRSELAEMQRQREADSTVLSEQIAELESLRAAAGRLHEASSSREQTAELESVRAEFAAAQLQRADEAAARQLAEMQSQTLEDELKVVRAELTDVQQKREAEASALHEQIAALEALRLQLADVQQKRGAETKALGEQIAEMESLRVELADVQRQREVDICALREQIAEIEPLHVKLAEVQRQLSKSFSLEKVAGREMSHMHNLVMLDSFAAWKQSTDGSRREKHTKEQNFAKAIHMLTKGNLALKDETWQMWANHIRCTRDRSKKLRALEKSFGLSEQSLQSLVACGWHSVTHVQRRHRSTKERVINMVNSQTIENVELLKRLAFSMWSHLVEASAAEKLRASVLESEAAANAHQAKLQVDISKLRQELLERNPADGDTIPLLEYNLVVEQLEQSARTVQAANEELESTKAELLKLSNAGRAADQLTKSHGAALAVVARLASFDEVGFQHSMMYAWRSHVNRVRDRREQCLVCTKSALTLAAQQLLMQLLHPWARLTKTKRHVIKLMLGLEVQSKVECRGLCEKMLSAWWSVTIELRNRRRLREGHFVAVHRAVGSCEDFYLAMHVLRWRIAVLQDQKPEQASATGKLSSLEGELAELKQILASGDEQRLELQCRLITAESRLNEASRDSLMLEAEEAQLRVELAKAKEELEKTRRSLDNFEALQQQYNFAKQARAVLQDDRLRWVLRSLENETSLVLMQVFACWARSEKSEKIRELQGKSSDLEKALANAGKNASLSTAYRRVLAALNKCHVAEDKAFLLDLLGHWKSVSAVRHRRYRLLPMVSRIVSKSDALLKLQLFSAWSEHIIENRRSMSRASDMIWRWTALLRREAFMHWVNAMGRIQQARKAKDAGMTKAGRMVDSCSASRLQACFAAWVVVHLAVQRKAKNHKRACLMIAGHAASLNAICFDSWTREHGKCKRKDQNLRRARWMLGNIKMHLQAEFFQAWAEVCARGKASRKQKDQNTCRALRLISSSSSTLGAAVVSGWSELTRKTRERQKKIIALEKCIGLVDSGFQLLVVSSWQNAALVERRRRKIKQQSMSKASSDAQFYCDLLLMRVLLTWSQASRTEIAETARAYTEQKLNVAQEESQTLRDECAAAHRRVADLDSRVVRSEEDVIKMSAAREELLRQRDAGRLVWEAADQLHSEASREAAATKDAHGKVPRSKMQELEQLQTAREDIRRRLDVAERCCDSPAQALRELDRQLIEAKDESGELTRRLHNVTAELDAALSAHEASKHQSIAELDAALSAHEASKHQFQSAQAKFQAELAKQQAVQTALQSEVQVAKDESERQRAELSDAERRIEDLEGKLAHKERDSAEMCAARDEVARMRDRKRARFEAAERHCAEMSKDIEQMQTDQDVNSQICTSRQEELRHLEAARDDMKHLLEIAEKWGNEPVRALRDLDRHFADLKEDHSRLNCRLQQVKSELETALPEHEAYKHESQSAQAKLEDELSEAKLELGKLSDLGREAAELRVQLEQCRHERSYLKLRNELGRSTVLSVFRRHTLAENLTLLHKVLRSWRQYFVAAHARKLDHEGRAAQMRRYVTAEIQRLLAKHMHLWAHWMKARCHLEKLLRGVEAQVDSRGRDMCRKLLVAWQGIACELAANRQQRCRYLEAVTRYVRACEEADMAVYFLSWNLAFYRERIVDQEDAEWRSEFRRSLMAAENEESRLKEELDRMHRYHQEKMNECQRAQELSLGAARTREEELLASLKSSQAEAISLQVHLTDAQRQQHALLTQSEEARRKCTALESELALCKERDAFYKDAMEMNRQTSGRLAKFEEKTLQLTSDLEDARRLRDESLRERDECKMQLRTAQVTIERLRYKEETEAHEIECRLKDMLGAATQTFARSQSEEATLVGWLRRERDDSRSRLEAAERYCAELTESLRKRDRQLTTFAAELSELRAHHRNCSLRKSRAVFITEAEMALLGLCFRSWRSLIPRLTVQNAGTPELQEDATCSGQGQPQSLTSDIAKDKQDVGSSPISKPSYSATQPPSSRPGSGVAEAVRPQTARHFSDPRPASAVNTRALSARTSLTSRYGRGRLVHQLADCSRWSAGGADLISTASHSTGTGTASPEQWSLFTTPTPPPMFGTPASALGGRPATAGQASGSASCAVAMRPSTAGAAAPWQAASRQRRVTEGN